jgi:hypothetical protein
MDYRRGAKAFKTRETHNRLYVLRALIGLILTPDEDVRAQGCDQRNRVTMERHDRIGESRHIQIPQTRFQRDDRPPLALQGPHGFIRVDCDDQPTALLAGFLQKETMSRVQSVKDTVGESDPHPLGIFRVFALSGVILEPFFGCAFWTFGSPEAGPYTVL